MKKITFWLLFVLATIIPVCSLSAQSLKQGTISNVIRLTNDGVSYENPRWAPDGSKIAFTEYGFNGLFVMNPNGSGKTKLAGDNGIGFMYQWSADSYEILVRDIRYEQQYGEPKRCQAAWSIDMTGKKTRLTEDVSRMDQVAWRYSPNGDKKVISLDAKVIAHPTTKLSKSLASSLSNKESSNISLLVNAEGLSVINARGVKTLINDKPSFCPALSPDGKRIVFNELNDIYIINIDGSGKRRLTNGFNPVWVNNSQIIFEVSTDDGHVYTSSDLYMMNVNGTGFKALTATTDKMEMCPSVSPDGSKIVFISHNDGQIYSADLK